MRRFVPEHAGTLRYEERLTDSDQWTLQSVIRNTMPMHRIALGDAAGTEYYVSERTGEPVLRTTASGRFWGYSERRAALAVLHAAAPAQRVLGATSSIWCRSSAPSCARWGSRSGSGAIRCPAGSACGGTPSHTPYAGWIKWHHYTGLVFGFFACTWAFSGALSLGPFAFLKTSPPSRAFREAATGGPIDLAPLTVDRIRAAAATVRPIVRPKELDFFQFQGEPYFVAYAAAVGVGVGAVEKLRHLGGDHAQHRSPARDRVGAASRSAERSRRSRRIACGMWRRRRCQACRSPTRPGSTRTTPTTTATTARKPLPVLRIRYDDRPKTWLYLDPQRGIIASRLERASRWNRWLYHGFHSLDFPFLYYKRPLWDIVVIVLSLGGIAISVTSALPAWRRLVRHGRQRLAGVGGHSTVERPIQVQLRTPESD